MNDSPTVRELQTSAGLLGYVYGLLKGQAVVIGVFNDSLHIAAAH